jgi:hypothetical protein
MIDRDGHDVEWTCDICDDTHIERDVRSKTDFQEAWEELKHKGWRTFQIEGMWQHKCPQCMKDKRNVRT